MAERTFAVESAGYWFREASKYRDAGDLTHTYLCMVNAFNHTENALFSARRELAEAGKSHTAVT